VLRDKNNLAHTQRGPLTHTCDLPPTTPAYQSVKNILRCQRLPKKEEAQPPKGWPTFVVAVIFMATFITFILYFYELNCLLLLYYYVSLRLFMRVFLLPNNKN